MARRSTDATARRRARGTLAVTALAVAAFGALAPAGVTAAAGADRIPPVAALRIFSAPGGLYRLELARIAAGGGIEVEARLLHIDAQGTATPRWQARLPQRQGPALALVSDEGRCVLIDELVNTPSPHAIVVIDGAGNTVARHTMHDIARHVALAPDVVAARATRGAWMSAEPRLAATGRVAAFEAGGVGFSVDLLSGVLRRP